MPTLDTEEVSRIARDILASIAFIDQQLKELEAGLHPYSDEALNKIKRIETEMPVLYDKICNHFEFRTEEFRAAFQKQFTYPSRFKTHASLEYILTYIYLLLDNLENGPLPICLFFADPIHAAYAQNMMKVNKEKVKPYVKGLN